MIFIKPEDRTGLRIVKKKKLTFFGKVGRFFKKVDYMIFKIGDKIL